MEIRNLGGDFNSGDGNFANFDLFDVAVYRILVEVMLISLRVNVNKFISRFSSSLFQAMSLSRFPLLLWRFRSI